MLIDSVAEDWWKDGEEGQRNIGKKPTKRRRSALIHFCTIIKDKSKNLKRKWIEEISPSCVGHLINEIPRLAAGRSKVACTLVYH